MCSCIKTKVVNRRRALGGDAGEMLGFIDESNMQAQDEGVV